MNVALGKHAYMSSSYSEDFVASHGNDGNNRTYFLTGYCKVAWWAVDFGQKNPKVVTRVRITHKFYNDNIGKYACVCVFTCACVKLTTSDCMKWILPEYTV